MSSDFDFINPYWEKVAEAEDKFFSERGTLKQTDLADFSVLTRAMERVDVAVFFLERLNLDEFIFQSGRINLRKLARILIKLIAERNHTHRENGQGEVNEVGLRAMELTLKDLFLKK